MSSFSLVMRLSTGSFGCFRISRSTPVGLPSSRLLSPRSLCWSSSGSLSSRRSSLGRTSSGLPSSSRSKLTDTTGPPTVGSVGSERRFSSTHVPSSAPIQTAVVEVGDGRSEIATGTVPEPSTEASVAVMARSTGLTVDTVKAIPFVTVVDTVDLCCKDAIDAINDTRSLMDLGLRSGTTSVSVGDAGTGTKEVGNSEIAKAGGGWWIDSSRSTKKIRLFLRVI